MIVDHVLQEPGWISDYLDATRGVKTHFVGLHCPIEILEQREQARGDRQIGLARMQLEKVHRDVPYDVELDTGMLQPEECRAKAKWAKLTDNDLNYVAGRVEELKGILAQKYGFQKEEADQEVDNFLKTLH